MTKKEELLEEIGIMEEEKKEESNAEEDKMTVKKEGDGPRARKPCALARSHSWQGFGTKEIKRQIRQQAFWDSQRYEQESFSQRHIEH